jgi:nicotine blue oxidoreductase
VSPPKQVELLPRVLDALGRSSVDGVVVVSGAHPLDVESIPCPDWERGPGASLRCGLAALPAAAEAALVVLADGPELDPRAVDRVAESWRAEGGTVVAASYGGVRLHPVLLARAAFGLVPDEGARALEARLVVCDDLSPPGDVDLRR